MSGYFITDNAWEEEALALKKVLKEYEPEAQYDSYYRNGYDAPMRIFNRRNEIWYKKVGPAATKAIEEYKKRQAEKVVAEPTVAATEDKKPAADEKKPAADEKKPAEEKKKTEEKKKVDDKKAEEEKKP